MICGLALGSLVLSGCLKDNDGVTEYPVAGLYLYNAYTGSSGLAVRLGQNVVRDVYNPLVYKNAAYVNAYSGNRNLIFYTNSNNSLVDTTVTLQQGVYYTAYAYGVEDSPKLVMTKDVTIEELGENASAVRFFNLAAGTGAVSLTIGDEDSPSFVNRPTETQESTTANEAFEATMGGNYVLQVSNAAGETIARREGVTLANGKYYSIILVGISGDTNMPLNIEVMSY